jgi:hypothetical protein
MAEGMPEPQLYHCAKISLRTSSPTDRPRVTPFAEPPVTTEPFVRVVLVPVRVLASAVEEVPNFVSTPFKVRVFDFILRLVAPPDTPFPVSAAPAAAAAEEVDEEEEEEDQEERIRSNLWTLVRAIPKEGAAEGAVVEVGVEAVEVVKVVVEVVNEEVRRLPTPPPSTSLACFRAVTAAPPRPPLPIVERADRPPSAFLMSLSPRRLAWSRVNSLSSL